MPAPITDSKAGEISEEDAHKRFKRIDAKLRRLCEQKPSGKLNVPRALHEMWLKGGQERDELRAAFERFEEDKEPLDLESVCSQCPCMQAPKTNVSGIQEPLYEVLLSIKQAGCTCIYIYIYIYVYMYKPRALTQTVVVVLQTLGI